MSQIPVIMPQLGESIAEATVVNILVPEGGQVEAGQDVLEVETSKATMTVAAPCKGVIGKWLVQANESYPVGEVLGFIEARAEDVARAGLEKVAEPESPANEQQAQQPQQAPAPQTPPSSSLPQTGAAAAAAAAPKRGTVEPRVRGLPVPAHAATVSYMSPRLKARINELGLHAADLAGIAGSGAGGRVTIEDFERYIANLEKQKLTQASPMRVAVADAMRRSWSRPLATVGLAATLDAVLEHRKKLLLRPGPALYALRALAIALSENSAIAGRLIGNKIVHPSSIDIGFAVEAEAGVLVPVIRNADKRPLLEIADLYSRLVEQARQRTLPAEATGHCVATVTNYGTFGLIWATPIPLPEQTLVLGLGAGRKAPLWDDARGQFVPVTEAQLTLSFDHRVLDGGAAGRFLKRIVQLLNEPEKL